MNLNSISVTFVLIAINVIIFIIESIAGGSTKTSVALKFGAQYTPNLRRGQYYRLFTSMFLHFGLIHIACNMYALYSLGPALEYICGPVLYLVIYLVSGLCGNLLTWGVESINHKYSLSAGASGAIFGLMGAYLIIALFTDILSSGAVSSIGRAIVVNVIYGFVNKGINIWAHLGGFLGGCAATLVILFFYGYL